MLNESNRKQLFSITLHDYLLRNNFFSSSSYFKLKFCDEQNKINLNLSQVWNIWWILENNLITRTNEQKTCKFAYRCSFNQHFIYFRSSWKYLSNNVRPLYIQNWFKKRISIVFISNSVQTSLITLDYNFVVSLNCNW